MQAAHSALDNTLDAESDIETSCLITFRDSDEARPPLLRAVTARLARMARLEVIVVEQDAAPRLESEELGANVGVVFARNDGPSNASWSLNVAAKNASGQLQVIGDGDMLMDCEALDRGWVVCRDHYDAVSPYSNLVDLSEEETQSFLAGDIGVGAIRRREVKDRRPQGECLCFCGGICVFDSRSGSGFLAAARL